MRKFGAPTQIRFCCYVVMHVYVKLFGLCCHILLRNKNTLAPQNPLIANLQCRKVIHSAKKLLKETSISVKIIQIPLVDICFLCCQNGMLTNQCFSKLLKLLSGKG